MTTLQEQFERDFPDKGVEVIRVGGKYLTSNFTNRDLDLRGIYENVEMLDLNTNGITSINLSGCKNLNILYLSYNSLTSVDFLNTIPNPEKLETLVISSNKIQPTDISVFSKFINLKILRMGLGSNKFYGSFKS